MSANDKEAEIMLGLASPCVLRGNLGMELDDCEQCPLLAAGQDG